MGNETEEQVIDLTDTLGHISKTLDGTTVLLNDLYAKIDGGKLAKEEIVTKPKDTVALDDVGIGKFMAWDIKGVPVGGIVAGGFIGTFVTELVDGGLPKMSPQARGGIEIGLAFATVIFGHKVLGKTGAAFTAAFIGFDGLRKLVPIDTYALQLSSKITGMIPTAGLAQGGGRTTSVLTQAQGILTESQKRSMR